MFMCPYCGNMLSDETMGCCGESSGHMIDLGKEFLKQKKYCDGQGTPCFILEECPRCGEAIFSDDEVRSKADKEQLTQCPFCFYSFVE